MDEDLDVLRRVLYDWLSVSFDQSVVRSQRMKIVNIPPDQMEQVSINCANKTPNPHSIEPRERLFRHMRQNHATNLMGELQAPGTHKRHEQR